MDINPLNETSNSNANTKVILIPKSTFKPRIIHNPTSSRNNRHQTILQIKTTSDTTSDTTSETTSETTSKFNPIFKNAPSINLFYREEERLVKLDSNILRIEEGFGYLLDNEYLIRKNLKSDSSNSIYEIGELPFSSNSSSFKKELKYIIENLVEFLLSKEDFNDLINSFEQNNLTEEQASLHLNEASFRLLWYFQKDKIDLKLLEELFIFWNECAKKNYLNINRIKINPKGGLMLNINKELFFIHIHNSNKKKKEILNTKNNGEDITSSIPIQKLDIRSDYKNGFRELNLSCLLQGLIKLPKIHKAIGNKNIYDRLPRLKVVEDFWLDNKIFRITPSNEKGGKTKTYIHLERNHK